MNKETFSYPQLFAILIGNFLEWLDFSLLGLMAPIIANLFIGNETPYHKFVVPLLIFSIGIFFRPFGSLIFGYLGDRKGRRIILILSISIIVISLLAIAFLPTYGNSGMAATVLFLLVNILNGISFGAELPLSATLLFESSPPKSRIRITSFISISCVLGLMIGNLDFLLFVHTFDPTTGVWRIPFLVAGILGIIGFFYRRFLHESPVFLGIKSHHHLAKKPFKEIFTSYKRPYFLCCLMTLNLVVSFYTILVFTTAYQYRFLDRTPLYIIVMNLLMYLIIMTVIPFASRKLTKNNLRRALMLFNLLFVLFTIPCYYFLNQSTFFLAEAAQFVLAIFLGLLLAAYPSSIASMFPPQNRCSGIALSHNVMLALFGGTGPLIIILMINKTQNLLFPSYYITLSAAITLLALLLGKKTIQKQFDTI